MATPTDFKPSWTQRPADTFGTDLRDPAHLLADHVARYTNSTETRRKYLFNVTQFMLWMETYFPDVPLLATTPYYIDQFRTYLRSNHWDDHPGGCSARCKAAFPYAETSIDAKLSAISEFFLYCMRENRSSANPVQEEKHDNGDAEGIAHDEPILLPWEIETLGHAARSHSLRDEIMVGFLVGMAMRREELANVDIANFRPSPRGGAALKFKRKRGRMVILDVPDRLTALVEEYTFGRSTGPLLLSQRGRRRNPDTGELEWGGISAHQIRNRISALGAEAGLVEEGIRDGVAPHLLRHTAVTLFLTDPAAGDHRVMAYVGHAKFDTTLGYKNHPRLPTTGVFRNPYGPDWSRQAP